ncbi:MAG: hypothetical protein OEU86_00140 [Gammaproteobacteria bacterium]|nr:hypothetical protein [Gammaproteobacteria bacterium]
MCQLSDQFYAAVRTLASDGPIKKRLFTAFNDNLAHLSFEELPASIRTRFELLWESMHATKPTSKESPVLASVRKMSKADANRCANHIVAMFSELVLVKSTGEKLGDKQAQAAVEQNRYQSLN